MKSLLEIYEAKEDEIKTEVEDCYINALKSGGRVCYQLYLWEDGELLTNEVLTGSNSWMQPRAGEGRQLYRLTDIMADPWGAGDYDLEDERQRAIFLEDVQMDIIEPIMGQIWERIVFFNNERRFDHSGKNN